MHHLKCDCEKIATLFSDPNSYVHNGSNVTLKVMLVYKPGLDQYIFEGAQSSSIAKPAKFASVRNALYIPRECHRARTEA